MKYFWELEKRSGEIITLPEEAAKAAKTQWAAGKVVNFVEQAISPHEIREIRKTSRLDTEGQKLLADAETAFAGGKPVVVKCQDGEDVVKANCLIKQVTSGEWEKRYSRNQSYDLVPGLEGHWVAYSRPAHLGIPSGSEVCNGRCNAHRVTKKTGV